MYPEDRVLVAIMNSKRDFAIARDEGWYRIPVKHAPKGIYSEYLAFYFTKVFGPEKWAIHYYAPIQGHELVTRRQLLPDEPHHPRADERYYKLQIGCLQRKEPPIVSRRWRRITFIHTTWDRFQDAEEINDLFVTGKPYVDRIYTALRDVGIPPEREYQIGEGDVEYTVDLAVPCRHGLLSLVVGDRDAPAGALRFAEAQIEADLEGCLATVQAAIAEQGGMQDADY